MHVKELWRYPVKSLGGERVEESSVGELGLTGDRLVLVQGPAGRLITSRSHPKLLALKGSLGEDGEPRINEIKWNAPEALDLIRAAAGPAATLLYYEGPERFDVLPLSVATDGAIQHMKFDGRRLRPNIVIGGVEGLAERTWPGRNLKIGSLLIHAQRLRPRCVMTTWDPDTQEQDISVLKRIVRELNGEMSLDCSVLNPHAEVVFHCDFSGMLDLFICASQRRRDTSCCHRTGNSHFSLAPNFRAGNGSIFFVQNPNSRGRQKESQRTGDPRQ